MRQLIYAVSLYACYMNGKGLTWTHSPPPPSPSLSLRKIREELAFMWNGCGIAYFWIADQINMRVYDYDTRNSLFLCSAFYVCLATICCGFSLFTPAIFIIRNY